MHFFLASGEQVNEELTQEDIDRCEEAVRLYLDDPDPESTLNIGHDLRKIQKCFKILKVCENSSISSRAYIGERPPAFAIASIGVHLSSWS